VTVLGRYWNFGTADRNRKYKNTDKLHFTSIIYVFCIIDGQKDILNTQQQTRYPKNYKKKVTVYSSQRKQHRNQLYKFENK